jgi:2-polyprenyl-3-methyl-5-hydroxy-6-metoxy-1,4-benzoquinol methylase
MTVTPAVCPACGVPCSRRLGSHGLLTLHRCDRCTLVFVWPQPRELVSHKYLHQYDLAAHFASWVGRKRVLYERRLARLPRPGPGRDRLCDVGCADGQFLTLAASAGWRPFGIELNPPAAAAARARGAEVAVGLLEALDDLPFGQFDLVTSWDVLEHTPDPRPFAQHLARLLRPGGTLVVTTLNYDSLVRRCVGFNWSMVCEDHFTYWTRRSLRRLLEDVGMTVTTERSFGLGRDFVRLMDWLAPGRTHAASAEAPLPETPRRSSWDVNPVVLTLENTCNRLLNLTNLGVGVEAVACRL